MKYLENPFSGSRTVSYGQTDRHYEADSSFPQFWERAQNPVNWYCTAKCWLLFVKAI